MTQFNHVEDKTIRSVLEGDVSEDALCYAINETLRHSQADQASEDVPYVISEQRLALAQDASDWWNEDGDMFKAVEALRECWLH